MDTSVQDTLEHGFWHSLLALFEISLQLLWSILAVGGIGFWTTVWLADFSLFFKSNF
jgi:hypothetical protein